MLVQPPRAISPVGRRLIIGEEGVVLHAYPDPISKGDPWTIGVGHTGQDVKPGMTITYARAMQLLDADLAERAQGVNHLAPVTTQGQFDALVSFAFNLGLRTLGQSTLLKLHNAGNYEAAALEFPKWTLAGGHVVSDLVRRRTVEQARYRSIES